MLFSGGQDSSICLAWALARFETVDTVGFDYGQRHHVELDARRGVRAALAAHDRAFGARLGADAVIDLSGFGAIAETALTAPLAVETGENGVPNTFVPGRNLIFLVAAAALAHRTGAGVLVGGMCEADYSGYPDCRSDVLGAQLTALRLGMDADFALETPLSSLTKAESWRLAERIGGKALVDLINEHSHTCYLGDRGARHPWGYGCGECPACLLREKGWADYTSSRPI